MELFTFNDVKEELLKEYDGIAVGKLMAFIRSVMLAMFRESYRYIVDVTNKGEFIHFVPFRKKAEVIKTMQTFNRKWVRERNYSKYCK